MDLSVEEETGNHDDESLIERDSSSSLIESDIHLWGWFNIRHRCLQVFNSGLWLCVTLSTFMFVQGMIVSGFVATSISTIERRFELPSIATGLIVSVYDLTAAICVLFMSFYSDYGNKPRILGIGAILMGFGCFTWTLPHFLTTDYKYGTMESNLLTCAANSTIDCVTEEETSKSHILIVFIIGQVLIGCGASPLYTLGTTYLDENVRTEKAGIYVGICYGFSALGPACGLVLGGAFLTLYTSLSEATNVTITQEHPAWVGAWWLGFFIGSIAVWCIVLPISGFPREMKKTKQIKEEEQLEMLASSSPDVAKKPRYGMSVNDFPSSVWSLLRNATYLCITGTAITEGLLIGGFTYFMPKFIENQFAVTSSAASALCGVAVIPGAAGGTFLGGWFIKKFKLKVLGMIRFSLVVAILTLASTPYLLLSCPKASLAGVSGAYDTLGSEVNFTHGCNADCECTRNMYSPVCGNDGLVYFNPCSAGCMDYSQDGQTFYNCQCIPEFNCTVNGESYSSGCATVGECDKACWTLPVFLMLFFLSMLMNFQLTVPAAAITLRCVPENQRMLAMSIQSVFARLFGAVPGLLIVGATIDSTCLIWQESCDQTGACWVYDTFQYGLRFFILAAIYLSCTVLFLFLALFVYRPLPCKDHVEDVKFSNTFEDDLQDKDTGGILIDFKTKYRNGAADLAKEEPLIIREDSRANLSDEQTPMKLKAAKDE